MESVILEILMLQKITHGLYGAANTSSNKLFPTLLAALASYTSQNKI